MINWTKEKDSSTTGARFKFTAEDGRVVVEYDHIFKKWFGYVCGEFIASNKKWGEVMQEIVRK